MNSKTGREARALGESPTIKAQVMPAKLAWKAANTISGMTTPLLKVAAL